MVAILALNLQYLPAAPETLWVIGPAVAITISGTLALSYNRSRVFLVCCLLAFCLWLYGQPAAAIVKELVIAAIVPVNLLLICFYRERGAFTFSGVMRLILIAAQISFGFYAISNTLEMSSTLIDPFTGIIGTALAYSPFHQITTLLLLTSFLGSVVLMGLDDTPITQGLVTALIGLILGFISTTAYTWEVFLMASSLYLGASIIRDSYNMAYRDELTRLPHRRALNEQFLSLGNKYVLAMLDVDHFKKFNDRHGHDVGDQVLQLVARKIQQVGGNGKAYRYGGEEFAVIFSRMSKEDAFYYLEEVRQSIQDYEVVIRGEPREDENMEPAMKKQRQKGSYRTADKKVSVTISIGIADRVSNTQTPEDVLKAADQALYAAKKAGRNQVTLAT